jgi:hypothetical protein
MAEPQDTENADALEESLWQCVVNDWTSDEAHAAYLQHCRASGRLAEAVQRYRQVSGPMGKASESAVRKQVERRLEAIAMLVVADLEATRQQGKPHRKMHLALQALSVLFFLTVLSLLVRALLGY